MQGRCGWKDRQEHEGNYKADGICGKEKIGRKKKVKKEDRTKERRMKRGRR